MNYQRAGALLTSAVVTALLIGCAKSPESTVESFYRALGKGELTEAKSYVSPQLIAMLGEGKISVGLSSETEKIRNCGGIKDVKVSLEGEGEVRMGIVTVQYNRNCPARIEKTKLIKENGKWKITAQK